jgi:amino acid transporter
MLWIILIVLIIVGVCTNNYTPLKVFGKIMAWFFGIILAICLIVTFIAAIITLNNKKEQEAYWERVKQTPLVQWACDSDGYQLYLGERPEYVYQCSTGKLIAYASFDGYTCKQSYKTVNHWKFCEHKANLSNSKYNNLLGN